MKQHNTAEELREIIDDRRKQPVEPQASKRHRTHFRKYEEQIEDKYIDTEDHLNLFISKIGQSFL